MMVFFEVIFPVVFIVSIGYLAGKTWSSLDLKTISRISMYILSPALIFTSLLKGSANDAGMMFIFTLLLSAGIYLMAFIMGKIMRLNQADQNGLYLSTLFFNAGNYGIPIALFAFGTVGMEQEVLMLVYQNMLVSTLGIYIASSSHLNWRDALKTIFKLPPFYAAAAAFALRMLHVSLPGALMKPLELMGQGTVPLFMLALGIQLSRTKLGRELGFISVATLIRLVFSPLLAVGLVYVLGITGLTAKIVILASATPTAVTATLYSIEFGASPEKVSGVTLITTLLSILTVTALIWGWLI